MAFVATILPIQYITFTSTLTMKNALACHLLLAFVALAASNCKKNKPSAVLPEATRDGKNTIGFTIDEKVWLPYAKCGFAQDPCNEILAAWSSPVAAPDAIAFQFRREHNGRSSSLTISSTDIGTITGTGEKIDSIGVVFSDENAGGLNGRYAYPAAGSTFTITRFDKINKIISGEFELILQEQNQSGRQLVLKNGRFDFIFNTCRCSQ